MGKTRDLFKKIRDSKGTFHTNMGFPGASVVKNPPPSKRYEFDPWVRKILWRRKQQPTPVFLPGKSHGQRRLTSYSPWGHKELDMTEEG